MVSEEEKIREECKSVRDQAREKYWRACDPAREEYYRVCGEAIRVRDVQLAKLQKGEVDV